MGYNLNNDVPLGQLGSAYLNDGNAFTPPTGRVIIAITMVGDTAFDQLVPELPTDSTFKGSVFVDGSGDNQSDINCIGTVAATAANGTGADDVAVSDGFPAGLTIYGRWKTVELNDDITDPVVDSRVILYFGV